MADRSNLELLDALFTTDTMRAVFTDHASLQGMLDFEAALTTAEGQLGIVPSAAVAPIIEAARAERYSVAAIALAAATAGNPAIPLVQAMTVEVARTDPTAAQWVHWGATSQDAIDTGRMLQFQRALKVLAPDVTRLKAALAILANIHRHTVMPGRTLLQHAAPISFGLKIAGWLDGVLRCEQRLHTLRENTLALQLGGAVGNFAVLGARGLEVAARMAEALHLRVPDLPWHTQRDRIVECGSGLAFLIGTLGKIAADVLLLMQSEIGEVSEPAALGRGGSSTLPHKHNPLSCTVALAAAARAPGLMASLYGLLPQEHERGVGGWHTEWTLLPELCCLAAGSLAQITASIEGLGIDAAKMRLHASQAPGVLFAERIAVALTAKLGKLAAQTLAARLSADAVSNDQHLRDVVLDDPTVREALSTQEIEQLFDPTRALGASDQLIDRVLARV